MPPVGFEPTVSAGERPQAPVIDGETTGIEKFWYTLKEERKMSNSPQQYLVTYYWIFYGDLIRIVSTAIFRHT